MSAGWSDKQSQFSLHSSSPGAGVTFAAETPKLGNDTAPNRIITNSSRRFTA